MRVRALCFQMVFIKQVTRLCGHIKMYDQGCQSGVCGIYMRCTYTDTDLQYLGRF
jgi:hypothetical protein